MWLFSSRFGGCWVEWLIGDFVFYASIHNLLGFLFGFIAVDEALLLCILLSQVAVEPGA